MQERQEKLFEHVLQGDKQSNKFFVKKMRKILLQVEASI